MIKFYQPITTISGMIGSVTGCILNIIQKNFPENFFNHVYIDTRLASVEQRQRKKKILGFALPALALKPNFSLEDTLIDATDIMPFYEVLIKDEDSGLYIESIMKRVRINIEVKMKIESKLKTWDVIGWLNRVFLYKAPAVIPNVFLESVIPANLIKDLIKFKGYEQTISDVDKTLMYLNEYSHIEVEFLRRFNTSIGKNSILYRHPRNILYTINEAPQAEFSKKGLTDSENYISMEISVETWFPVGYRTNFQNNINGSNEDIIPPEIETPPWVGEYDYPYDQIIILEDDDYDGQGDLEGDPFYPPDDLYLPDDENFYTEDFSNLVSLFTSLNNIEIEDLIKLYLKNYNASKESFYNFDTILDKNSRVEKLEHEYERFITIKNKAKIGLNRKEIPEFLYLQFMNSNSFKLSNFAANQIYGNLIEPIVFPELPESDNLTDTHNPPSTNINIFEYTDICNLSDNELGLINNEIYPDPDMEEVWDAENELRLLLSSNSTLLDYYLEDDSKQVILSFHGPMTHGDYDEFGFKKIFSTFFVSDVNTNEDSLVLYEEFTPFFRNLISKVLAASLNLRNIFHIYLYSRNGSLINPDLYRFDWETLKILFLKTQINMNYNLVIYANLVQLKMLVSQGIDENIPYTGDSINTVYSASEVQVLLFPDGSDDDETPDTSIII
jgi:hypothetical protein